MQPLGRTRIGTISESRNLVETARRAVSTAYRLLRKNCWEGENSSVSGRMSAMR